jgi:MFS family permease
MTDDQTQNGLVTTTDVPTSGVDGVSPMAMRKVALAAFVGSTVEFYDFFIYGTAAALVFPKVFFPALGPAAGTIASFATLGVAFVARPFGAVLFGHFGDKLGRKKTLVTTLLVMGIATVLVGLIPTPDKIGAAAPIALVLLRILQGLAAGGEWAGAALFASESAPKAKRGFWSAFPSLGGGAALFLGNLTFLIIAVGMSDDDFVSYGWRIPFIASIVLIGLGLWIRLRTEETPVFKAVLAKGRTATHLPFVAAFKYQPRQMLLGIGMVILVPTLTYLGATYLTNYGSSVLGFSRTTVLLVGTLAALSISAATLLGGTISDRFGRRRVIMGAAIIAVPWALVLFPLIATGSSVVYGIVIIVTLFISGMAYGPMASFLSEMFDTRYRYTAAGLSYSIANVIGGAIPPIIGAALTAAYGGWVFGIFVAALCAVSLVSVSRLKETRGQDMEKTVVLANV